MKLTQNRRLTSVSLAKKVFFGTAIIAAFSGYRDFDDRNQIGAQCSIRKVSHGADCAVFRAEKFAARFDDGDSTLDSPLG